MNGREDYSDFIENSKLLEKKLKKSVRVEFEDAGHMVNLEYADRVNKLIDDFLIKSR